MKTMSDLNISHGKMSDFVSVSLLGLTLVIESINFDFKSDPNTSIFFDKKDLTSNLKIFHGKTSDFV